MGRIIVFILMLILAARQLNQVRKPKGLVGKFVLWIFSIRHSKLTDWGLKHVKVGEYYTILDVGCGGGRMIYKLAGMTTKGKVFGIDHSKQSVAASHNTNRYWIGKGRVEIQHGSVSNLPFRDDIFDLVTAVETHYYWPNLVTDMREILRVLKPGGKLIVIVESYASGGRDKEEQLSADAEVPKKKRSKFFTQLSVTEHKELFSEVGFAEAEIYEEHKEGWLCGIATKR
jgi:SAM-dependent methyltransferase